MPDKPLSESGEALLISAWTPEQLYVPRPCSPISPYCQEKEKEIRARWVLTLLLCPDQCTMAWLWAESPVSANEVLGNRSSSVVDPPVRGAFTSSREPLARGRLPLEPSAGAVARASPRSRALGGCARRLLLTPPGFPGAGMPGTHHAPSGDVPWASTCISPPLGWGNSSGPGRRLSAAAAVASSSDHWFATARGRRPGNAGGREAGAVRRPGLPVVPQVISAPARTHVNRSRSPVRARGAPGQPVGRSLRAASIPLRLPRLGLPSVWRPPRCGSGAGGVRAPASERVSVSGEWGGGGREGGGSGWRASPVLCTLPPSRSLACSLVQRMIPKAKEN